MQFFFFAVNTICLLTDQLISTSKKYNHIKIEKIMQLFTISIKQAFSILFQMIEMSYH